jgi:four helix bundle protein
MHSHFRLKNGMIKSYRDLEVFQRSYKLALVIKNVTLGFPSEEIYLLRDQLNRSTRSIPANIAEGWAKRNYTAIFRRHLIDALGSSAETEVHLRMALDFGYVSNENHATMHNEIIEIGKMLNMLHRNWKSFK